MPYRKIYPPEQVPACPSCTSPKVNRFGIRRTSQGSVQVYLCKSCKGHFSDRDIKYTQYPSAVVVKAVSSYNLGNTLEDTKNILIKRHRMKIPLATIHSWIKKYEKTCTFSALRSRFKIDPQEIIKSKKLYHQQVYNFKYHQLKLNLAAKTFPALRKYIRHVFNNCPDALFKQDLRCSSFKSDELDQMISHRKLVTADLKTNNAIKLTELALVLSKRNTDRHELVQDIMIINDSATVAVEVPVYLYPKELMEYGLDSGEPLTGHIDIVQVRWDRIHILDYKPDLRPDVKTISQLFMYSLALSKRTGISIDHFSCAFFNEKRYVEFKPSLVLSR
jgi:transposase-like protein